MPLSITTINIIGISKIILALWVVSFFFLLWRRKSAFWHLASSTSAIIAFTAVLLWPLQKMWWGNNGDETFVGAFLLRVMEGQPFSDFYYAWLPPFYPPLYFWVVGGISSLIAATAITGAKVGIVLTLLAWFLGTYAWQYGYWRWIEKPTNDAPEQTPWFWLLCPLLFFLVLDFDTILLKPYETVTALWCALYVGYFARALHLSRWSPRHYIFFILSGGILFLTYYFWWFMLAPAMLALALWHTPRWPRLRRTVLVGLGVGLLSALYVIPLVVSMARYGTENWQARYFVPQDFFFFAPWANFEITGLLVLGGVVALIVWRRVPFVQSLLIALGACYLYQLVNVTSFLGGWGAAQAAKPFLFFGTALFTTGAAYGLVQLAQTYRARFSATSWNSLLIAGVVLLIPLAPMVRFIDDPVVQRQLELDQKTSSAQYLAGRISAIVPDYRSLTWLSSGTPEINLYLPLTYYISHNPHFSHPASNYSIRFAHVQRMLSADAALEFTSLADAAQPPISGLLLYRDTSTKTYPFFFWEDTFPNGGKERRLDLRPELIDERHWESILIDKEWILYRRR